MEFITGHKELEKRRNLPYCPACAIHMCVACYAIFHCALDVRVMKLGLKNKCVKGAVGRAEEVKYKSQEEERCKQFQ